MKQTAVDWLEDNLIGNPFSAEDFAHNVKIFKKAKEMMEDQIKMAFVDGKWDGKFINLNSEQYYNETYGNK
jgi:hypothetical protein